MSPDLKLTPQEKAQMNKAKPALKSKGVQGGLIATIAASFAMFQDIVTGEEVDQIITNGVILVGALRALWGRIAATSIIKGWV